MFCSGCGTALGGNSFCTECGTPKSQNTPSAPPQPPTLQPVPLPRNENAVPPASWAGEQNNLAQTLPLDSKDKGLSRQNPTTVLGWIAFGLALAGLIFAVLPALSFVAWFFTIPAFVIAIVALAKKSKKLFPLLALIISVISGILAVVVSIVTALALTAGAATSALDAATATLDEAQAGIGVIVPTDNGANFTVNSVTCGLTAVLTYYDTEEIPRGEFCEIAFTVTNTSNKEENLLPEFVGGLIGETRYAANTSASFFNDKSLSTVLNPGLSISGVAIVDVPVGSMLDAVTFRDGFLGNEIAVLATTPQ